MKVSLALRWWLSLLLLIFLPACGGGGGDNGPPNIQLSISPFQVNLDGGQTQQFVATVTGSTNTAVTWAVAGTNCTGSACGSIDANGLYTAPALIPADAAVRVSATAQANTGVTMSSTVNLKAITVTATPDTMTVEAGDQYPVTAAVAHTTNTAVTWTMTGTGCTGAACGTLSNAGVYTAPLLIVNPATVTVTAASVADNTKTDTCVVTLVPLSVTISPKTLNMDAAQSQQFTATISNHDNKSVTWSVAGVGSITNTGLYSTPAVVPAGTTTIIATSVADPTKTATATVTLVPLVITIAPTTANLGASESQQFAATVSHHVNKGVTWSLSGEGTLGTTGLYTAPAVIAAQTSATVRVTSVADTGKWASAVISLIPITVTVSPGSASVALNGTQQFTAAVSGTTNKQVTWTLNGAGCTGNACGTISSAGLYTAPANAPNPATVTVTAISAQDATKKGTATVTITQNLNARLLGLYAFWLEGFDASDNLVATAGSFVADGDGKLTGQVDSNGVASSPHTGQTLTGTYQVSADGRGTLTFAAGTTSTNLRFAMNTVGDDLKLIEFDTDGRHAAGFARKQKLEDVTKIKGDYAFVLSGRGVYGDRHGVIGRFHTDDGKVVSAGVLDTKTAGETPELNVAFTGTMSPPPNYGDTRFTIALTAGGQTIHGCFYVVSADELIMMVTDQTGPDMPLLSGRTVRQSGAPFSKATWKGGSAYYSTGVTTGPQAAPELLIGYMEADGVGGLYVEYARNYAGLIAEYGNGTATYDVQSNGMGTFTSNTYGDYAFVLTGPNQGFLMGVVGVQAVEVGEFDNQVVPVNGFKAASFNATYNFGTAEMATAAVQNVSGDLTWNGAGGVAGTSDASGTGGNLADLSLAGTYAVTGSQARSANGRGTLQLTAPSASKFFFYPVSDSKIFMINVDQDNQTASVLTLEK